MEGTLDSVARADLARQALPAACREVVRQWIGGEWVEGRGGSFPTIDPTTGEPLLDVTIATAAEVDAAVAAAAAASEPWWESDGIERGRILRRFADLIRTNGERLGRLDTIDAGRPLRDTTTRDVERAARTLEYFAGVTDKIRGANIPVQPGFANITFFEPYGVVAGIIPWNYPMTNAITKIAPALATGNGIVLKPAELSPLSACLLGELADQAGLPKGLLNILHGPGEITGNALAAHAGVGKVAFTGSTVVGRQIGRLCGESLKSVTLELGGKSPNIVFEDADLDTAVEAAAFTIAVNQGQTCTAGTRLLLQAGIAEAFVPRLIARLSRLRIGDPLNPEVEIGPVISRTQLERIERYVGAAERGGGRVVRIEQLRPLQLRNGFFCAPVVVSHVATSETVAQEEVFGPLLTVFVFDTEEEALALANQSSFGLAAMLWTNDIRRVHRMTRRLSCGIVWNNVVHALHPGSPYGGYKASGMGVEMGMEAITQFMKIKSLWIGINEWRSGWQS
jgi:acyl-CoA reductase-like NAD-dependent aldehyde dehydrogenase